jgi:hypothetical protein
VPSTTTSSSSTTSIVSTTSPPSTTSGTTSTSAPTSATSTSGGGGGGGGGGGTNAAAIAGGVVGGVLGLSLLALLVVWLLRNRNRPSSPALPGVGSTFSAATGGVEAGAVGAGGVKPMQEMVTAGGHITGSSNGGSGGGTANGQYTSGQSGLTVVSGGGGGVVPPVGPVYKCVWFTWLVRDFSLTLSVIVDIVVPTTRVRSLNHMGSPNLSLSCTGWPTQAQGYHHNRRNYHLKGITEGPPRLAASVSAVHKAVRRVNISRQKYNGGDLQWFEFEVVSCRKLVRDHPSLSRQVRCLLLSYIRSRISVRA